MNSVDTLSWRRVKQCSNEGFERDVHDSHSFRRHRLASVTSYLGLCTYMRLTDPLPPFLDLTVPWKLDIQPLPEEATSGPYPVAFVNKAAYHCHLRSQLANTPYDDWFSITFSLQWKFSMAHLIILKEKCIAFLIHSGDSYRGTELGIGDIAMSKTESLHSDWGDNEKVNKEAR